VGCEIPAQDIYAGFCYDDCPAGYKPEGGQCYRDCPPGFVDHGMACEPPSVLRKPVRAFMTPCSDGQIDVNGDCYEPQVATWYNKVAGCGCVRKKLADRLQCPEGYELYNNSCVTKCPEGFADYRNASGKVASLYCYQECPLKRSSNSVRWTFVGGLCVKEHIDRARHDIIGRDASGNSVYRVALKSPNGAATILSKRAMTQGANSRYRLGFDILNPLGDIGKALNPATYVNSFLDSLFEPAKKILLLAALVFGAFFGLPSLFKLISSVFGAVGGIAKGVGAAGEGALTGVGAATKGIGTGVGSVASGTGALVKSVETGVGRVAEGAGSALGGLGDLVGAAEQSAASRARAGAIKRVADANSSASDRQLESAQAIQEFLRNNPDAARFFGR
jgi:hypothetical protein